LGCTALNTIDDNGTVIYQSHFGSGFNDSLKHAIKFHPAERYRLYYNRFNDYFINNNITGSVVMEDPIGIGVGHGSKILELKGLYLVVLSFHIPTHKIFLPKAKQIKKLFTGYGNATKDLMISCCREYGYNPKNDHDADAHAMARLSLEGLV
jgi:hypothetical protein